MVRNRPVTYPRHSTVGGLGLGRVDGTERTESRMKKGLTGDEIVLPVLSPSLDLEEVKK